MPVDVSVQLTIGNEVCLFLLKELVLSNRRTERMERIELIFRPQWKDLLKALQHHFYFQSTASWTKMFPVLFSAAQPCKFTTVCWTAKDAKFHLNYFIRRKRKIFFTFAQMSLWGSRWCYSIEVGALFWVESNASLVIPLRFLQQWSFIRHFQILAGVTEFRQFSRVHSDDKVLHSELGKKVYPKYVLLNAQHTCLKNSKCLVGRVNRESCQSCCFDKCVEAGLEHGREYTPSFMKDNEIERGSIVGVWFYVLIELMLFRKMKLEPPFIQFRYFLHWSWNKENWRLFPSERPKQSAVHLQNKWKMPDPSEKPEKMPQFSLRQVPPGRYAKGLIGRCGVSVKKAIAKLTFANFSMIRFVYKRNVIFLLCLLLFLESNLVLFDASSFAVICNVNHFRYL